MPRQLHGACVFAAMIGRICLKESVSQGAVAIYDSDDFLRPQILDRNFKTMILSTSLLARVSIVLSRLVDNTEQESSKSCMENRTICQHYDRENL